MPAPSKHIPWTPWKGEANQHRTYRQLRFVVVGPVALVSREHDDT